MTMITFMAEGSKREGYLAIPKSDKGKGILVLHTGWGLTNFIKLFCDRLALQGFVAFAPDLHQRKIALTPDEAGHLLENRDKAAARVTAGSAMHFLQAHSTVQSKKLAAIGFSIGASNVLLLDSLYPDAFDKSILFYGASGKDLSQSNSKFLCHYGEKDDWEPLDKVMIMKAENVEICTYPNAYHWFFESDKPDHYNAEAARLAWKRTFEFLLNPIKSQKSCSDQQWHPQISMEIPESAGQYRPRVS